MIEYYDGLTGEEQREVTEVIRLLLHQTFILERKYDRRTERFQYNRDYRICGKHLEFIRAYLAVCGITVEENSQTGVIYIRGESRIGEKLSRLATLYLLILKVIYDEQMETVSTSVNVYTTLGEIHAKLGNSRLLKRQPSATDIRRAIAVLKKYQIIEPLELLEDLKASSRLIVYPCISMVLMGDDVRELLATFGGDESADSEEGADAGEDADTEEGAEDADAAEVSDAEDETAGAEGETAGAEGEENCADAGKDGTDVGEDAADSEESRSAEEESAGADTENRRENSRENSGEREGGDYPWNR